MKDTNKSSGFTIIDVLLVVTTLFFVVTIGWLVVSRQNDSSKKPATKVDLSGYVEVKEWHVYLQLPDSTQKVHYAMANKDQPNAIVVSSDSLDKFTTDHIECSAANQFVYISRLKDGGSVLGLSAADTKATLEKEVASGTAKKLGLFYYYADTPTISPCIGTDIPTIQKLNAQAYDLQAKLPTYQNVVVNP